MWQLFVGMRVLSAHILLPGIMKKVVGFPGKLRRLNYQFFICLLLSVVWVLLSPDDLTSLNADYSWLLLIGFFNSLACYFQWRAVDLSLSKTAMFTQADDIITILMGMIFLHEYNLLNLGSYFGLAVIIVAAIILAVARKRHHGSNLSLIGYVAGYSLIWGVAIFFVRVFALREMPASIFVLGWYGGSWLGMMALNLIGGLLSHRSDFFRRETQSESSPTQFFWLVVLSLLVWVSMALSFKVLEIAPLAVSQPIFFITEAIFPALIGFYLFHEIKQINARERRAFALGALGILIIAFSYRP